MKLYLHLSYVLCQQCTMHIKILLSQNYGILYIAKVSWKPKFSDCCWAFKTRRYQSTKFSIQWASTHFHLWLVCITFLYVVENSSTGGQTIVKHIVIKWRNVQWSAASVHLMNHSVCLQPCIVFMAEVWTIIRRLSWKGWMLSGSLQTNGKPEKLPLSGWYESELNVQLLVPNSWEMIHPALQLCGSYFKW